jgi:hypothetical protein
MNKLSRISPEFARTTLVGLMIECPRNHNSETCLLREKRELPFADKFEWAKSLPDDKLFNMYSAHLECMKSI